MCMKINGEYYCRKCGWFSKLTKVDGKPKDIISKPLDMIRYDKLIHYCPKCWARLY